MIYIDFDTLKQEFMAVAYIPDPTQQGKTPSIVAYGETKANALYNLFLAIKKSIGAKTRKICSNKLDW